MSTGPRPANRLSTDRNAARSHARRWARRRRVSAVAPSPAPMRREQRRRPDSPCAVRSPRCSPAAWSCRSRVRRRIGEKRARCDQVQELGHGAVLGLSDGSPDAPKKHRSVTGSRPVNSQFLTACSSPCVNLRTWLVQLLGDTHSQFVRRSPMWPLRPEGVHVVSRRATY